MTLSFSLFNGLIASWYSVMNITFASLPITDDPMEKDEIIGYIGKTFNIGLINQMERNMAQNACRTSGFVPKPNLFL